MGLFSLFKKNFDDPDMTRLRDLIVIGASDSDYSMKENATIVRICHEMGIPVKKIEKFFKTDPEKIKDIYPTSIEEKKRYMLQLIEIMTVDDVCDTREIHMLYEIGHNMGFQPSQVKDLVADYCRLLSKKRGEKIRESFTANQ